MEHPRQCCTAPTKDLQLLVQFGIRKKVQIRLVKLKVDVNYKRATTPKPKPCHNKQAKIQIPVRNRQHTKTEEVTKQFKCHLCNYSGAKLKYLKSHLRIHSDERPFTCQFCKYSTVNQYNLTRHLKIHTDERPFKCTSCGYKGRTRDYLNLHSLTHQGEKSYTCLFCTKGFIQSSSRNRHEKCCTKNPKQNDAKLMDENKRHKCHLCKFVSWNAADLRDHLRRHFGQKPFACNLCTYKCSSQGDLNSHIFTHTREKPFKCLKCDYSSSSASNLKSHAKRRHSKEIRNRNFSCNLCARNFHCKPHLYTHILSHTGETPFSCQFCERGFNRNASKNLHEKICRKNPMQKDEKWVKEQKVFKCELCQYSSIRKASLGAHLRRHTGSKPFHCSQCSFRSTTSSDLKNHSQRKHAEHNPFKCSHCNYGCVTSSILKRHISSHHSNIR